MSKTKGFSSSALALVSLGCSPGTRVLGLLYLHTDAGIVNVCKAALEAFDYKKPLLAVIGGYHLGGSGMEDRIPATVEYFANELQPRATYIVPMHCTGFKAKTALRDALGESVIPAGSGSRMVFTATEA